MSDCLTGFQLSGQLSAQTQLCLPSSSTRHTLPGRHITEEQADSEGDSKGDSKGDTKGDTEGDTRNACNIDTVSIGKKADNYFRSECYQILKILYIGY